MGSAEIPMVEVFGSCSDLHSNLKRRLHALWTIFDNNHSVIPLTFFAAIIS